MTKLFSISNPKTKQHLGSIIAERIVCDPSDNYLLFIDKNKTVAMFPAENISIDCDSANIEKAKTAFAEYQSNRVF